MSLPKPPEWFQKSLSSIDRSLLVFFNPKVKKWEIAQNKSFAFDRGIYDGMRLVEVKKVPLKIMYVEGRLGSAILDQIRMSDSRRYKNFAQMSKELNIIGHEQKNKEFDNDLLKKAAIA